MIEISEKRKCTGCEACANICPKKCIFMQLDEEGFRYPKVNLEQCVNCNLCVGLCPEKLYLQQKTTIYAAYNKDEKTRLMSSSGGIFSLFADYILSREGIVVGAYLDSSMNLYHICVEQMEDLSKLRGSKYIQSHIGSIYREIKNYLDNGKLVYFTGTSCQIHGLKVFLKNDYSNLICQDMACNGVTSDLLWKKYLQYLKNRHHKAEVISFDFRDKRSGWKQYSVNAKYNNGKSRSIMSYDDLFMRAYKSKLFMRPACYDCSFKGVNRESDITLADFWGVEHIMPEFDDDKGASLVMLHSSRGKEIFEVMMNHMCVYEIDAEQAVRYNPAIIKSVNEPAKRTDFVAEFQGNNNFKRIIKKYCGDSFTLDLKVKISRFIQKILKNRFE